MQIDAEFRQGKRSLPGNRFQVAACAGQVSFLHCAQGEGRTGKYVQGVHL
jgi:protein tyrosine phosphatase